MQNNLLLALSKYRPREGHTPLENFITESFAWLLRNNTHFVINFFKQFFDEDISASKVKVNTQINLEGNFPDMVITTDTSVWIFEHKTFTRLSPNQLNKYRDSANKQFNNVKIVLITGFKSQHEQTPEFKLTWCDVYNFLINYENTLNKESNDAIFFDYFSELLKENGLGPQHALSYESIINYLPTKDFKGNLQRILWAIHSRIKEDTDLDFFYERVEEEKNDNLKWNADLNKYWGRVGTEFLRTWRPGVFLGCIVDNKDHCNNYMEEARGIDYSLILSFDQLEGEYGEFKHYGKIDYEKDQLFKGLVDQINQNISNLGGYELYEHYHEQQHNSWHPLYIRRSIADILMGTKTQEEQIQKLLNDSKKIMELLIKCDNFSKLRETYNIKMLANNLLKPKPSASIEIDEILGSST